MTFVRLVSLFVIFYFMVGCSNDDDNTVNDVVVVDPDDDDDDVPSSDLEQRFVFDSNIDIEHSYNTGGCTDSSPCDTNQDGLVNIFNNALPNDPYFYLAQDESELFLECQLEKGRRAEVKQTTEGPLTSFSKIELEGIYYDIPQNGVTIAQVHNRGGNSNKPFFRLVIYDSFLETVIRKDPEVSSGATTFQKEEFSFVEGENYDQSPLKLIIEKDNGFVHINVMQNNTVWL